MGGKMPVYFLWQTPHDDHDLINFLQLEIGKRCTLVLQSFLL